MKLTWYGRGTWQIDIDGTTLLTDPYFDPDYTDVSPDQFETPDYVLVTHAHWSRHQHLCHFLQSTVVANTELVNYLLSEYALESTHVLNLGGALETDEMYVFLHNADHAHGLRRTSYTGLTYEENEINVGTAGGYIISNAAPTHATNQQRTTFYYTGETQLLVEMRDFIGEYHQPTAVALPIAEGAHVGRSTMGPWQAAIAAKWLDSEYFLPMIVPERADVREQLQTELSAIGAATKPRFLTPGDCFEL